MIRRLLAACLAAAAIAGAALPSRAQETQSVEAASGIELRVDWIGTVAKDCSVGQPPAVRPDKVADHGVIRILGATVTTKRVANCPELKVPARVVFYKSTAGYTGADAFALSVGEGASARVKRYAVTVR